VIGLLGDSLSRYGSLLGAAIRPPPGRRRPSARRLLVMVGFVPLFTAAQFVHWVCLLLDEILFPAYRRVPVREPLFVVGVPRSGTTLMHRVLARDPNLTTFSTWECLVAPSVTQRKLVRGLIRLDAAIGRPLARLLSLIETRVFGGLDDVHPMDLSAPEEDYLALLPVMACFVLVIPFPTAEPLWGMATVDRDMPAGRKHRLMAFYRRLLQRHLYVHGPDKRLLSKNAAFAGMVGALRETFPDARFVRCHRDPQAVVPSQLSAIQGGVSLFDSDPANRVFTARMTDVLRSYYDNLDRHLPRAGGDRHVVLDMARFKSDLAATVREVYSTLGLPLAAAFADSLEDEARAARVYRSRHRYAAQDFGLDETAIAAQFAPVQDRRGTHGHASAAKPIAPPVPAGQQGP